MPEVSLARWNDFLKGRPQVHFLQTGEWGELKSHFGWEAARVLVGRSGAQILFRHLPLGNCLAYIPKLGTGQVAPEDRSALWGEVDTLCRRRAAIACKLEPDAWIPSDVDPDRNPGDPWDLDGTFAPSSHSIQPRRTILVDLRPDDSTILGRMKQKCRYNIRLAEKKGVTVRSWSDFGAFHRMLQATAARDAFAVHSQVYYEQAYDLLRPAEMCELLVASHGGEPLSALMVLARGRRAWYVYGGSSDRQRELMPNYLLQWEAMRWAKKRGCEEYDLWGVPDEAEEILEVGFTRRTNGLWGVYRFKRGFGGDVRRAAAPLDRVYRRLLYRAYLLAATRRMST